MRFFVRTRNFFATKMDWTDDEPRMEPHVLYNRAESPMIALLLVNTKFVGEEQVLSLCFFRFLPS